MLEVRKLPHFGETFTVGVVGRKGARLEPATLRGYGNYRARTSIEIDKRATTSRMIDKRATSRMILTTSRRNAETTQPEFRAHRVERAWIQVVRRCLTK